MTRTKPRPFPRHAAAAVEAGVRLPVVPRAAAYRRGDEGHPSRGPATAPVTIVEFSDFECPFCYGLYPTLKLIERNYPEQVRIVYRQFPLTTIHPRAQKAAEASLCAHDQGRFWEMHDSMFGLQKELEVDALKQRAKEIQARHRRFRCLPRLRQQGRRDQERHG